MAVQILRAISPARVIAVDTSAEKLRLAREVGADATVEPGEGAAEAIRELTGGLGAELIVDNVGADETIALAAAAARFASDVTVVGLAGGKIEFAFGALPFDATLTVPYWGSAIELIEVLDLARAGKIKPHVERFPLDRVEDAYARLREGSLDGRAVICPHG
jgi:propanol-preferring alcohol dehydrogenase